MKYASQNGCLFYYDRDTYTWQLCEPTLLFLLGFEAITTYNKSRSDHLLISNKIYNTTTGELDDMPDFQIYDEAISYLASLGHVEDGEYYVQYNCYGLKLLLNELTGIGTDRTVPVIFLNDINRKLVDPNKYPYADKAGKSYYDLQSTLILNVFKYAGYDVLDNEIITVSEGIAGVDSHNPLNSNVPPLLDEITAYNSSIKILHEEKQAAGLVYKLLDYKAMYLYALGVLYGLRSMGYDGRMIWRFDPAYWYFDKYQNLVKTAWAVFRFHYSHSIYELDTPEELVNRYKDIQFNKLWNYINDDSSDVALYNNEVFAYGLYIKDIDSNESLVSNRVSVRPIIYLYPTDEELRNGEKGKFIEYLSDKQEWSSPKYVVATKDTEDPCYNNDPLVSSDIPYKGIVAADSDNYVRYIAHDKVNIRKALRYTRNILQDPNDSNSTLLPQYLSPNSEVLATIPSNTVVGVEDVAGNYYKVSYRVGSDTITGWISNTYTDLGVDGTPAVDEGEFLTELFEVSPYPDRETGEVNAIEITVTSPAAVHTLPGGAISYFISTGNLGWVDFNLTYWEKFRKYIASEYDGSELSNYILEKRANESSVLSMNEQEFENLFPQRIYSAFSPADGTAVSYYKCNVTDDIYLYGIFDGYVAEDPVTRYANFSHDYVDTSNMHTDVKDHFKYILSELDFNNMYVVSDAPSNFVKSVYYDVENKVVIYVDALHEPPLLFDGIQPRRIDSFGYTPNKATAIDAYYYYYNGTDESIPQSPQQFDLRMFAFDNVDKYWSHEFIAKTDEYGDYIEWVNKSNTAVKKKLNNVDLQVYENTNNTITLYMNVRKLFDNTLLYSCLDPNKPYNDFICNTNNDYTIEFGKYYENNIGIDYMPLGFIRYSDLHDSLGITRNLCQIIETDQNGDQLVIDGVPYAWKDPSVRDKPYWNGFIRQWQSEIPTRHNATMYNAETNKFIDIMDDPSRHIVVVEYGTTLTYDEFYSRYSPSCGITRNDTLQVFNPSHEGEGIVECYRDNKASDNEEDDIYCIPTKTLWVHRSELLNTYGYWIVDGTESLYNGDDSVSAVYDDDHRD